MLQVPRPTKAHPTAELSNEVRQILHRVGLALIAFGLLDMGLMIYCIANGLSYTSSFNIFAVISGIYLWRGHPWYVKWVTRAAGFYAAGFCMAVPLAFLIYPPGLAALEFRLHPSGVLGGALVAIGVIVFLMWVYHELRRAPVLASYSDAGGSAGSFWTAPLCGVGLVIGIGVLCVLLMHGDAERRAIELARVNTGPGYRYFVTHLSYGGDRGTGVVLAYDDRTIKTVDVDW